MVEMVTPISYAGLQQMFDESAPWGMYSYEKAVYLDDLTDDAIDVILEHQAKKMSPLSFVPIFVMGGAYKQADPDASAFGGGPGRHDARLAVIRSTHRRPSPLATRDSLRRLRGGACGRDGEEPSAWQWPARSPPWGRSVTPTTTRPLNPRSGCSRQSSSENEARGGAGTMSNSPPWSGSTGSTTDGCIATARISRRPSSKISAISKSSA
jgi:hypothetical protein